MFMGKQELHDHQGSYLCWVLCKLFVRKPTCNKLGNADPITAGGVLRCGELFSGLHPNLINSNDGLLIKVQ